MSTLLRGRLGLFDSLQKVLNHNLSENQLRSSLQSNGKTRALSSNCSLLCSMTHLWRWTSTVWWKSATTRWNTCQVWTAVGTPISSSTWTDQHWTNQSRKEQIWASLHSGKTLRESSLWKVKSQISFGLALTLSKSSLDSESLKLIQFVETKVFLDLWTQKYWLLQF